MATGVLPFFEFVDEGLAEDDAVVDVAHPTNSKQVKAPTKFIVLWRSSEPHN